MQAEQISVSGWMRRVGARGVLALATGLFALSAAQAQETVCASVKIRIKQELTLERQAFDAEMKINNTTDTSQIENVAVVVKVTEENGTPVAVSEDPNSVGAKFFIRVSGKQAIADVNGAGTVAPQTTAIINWLLIPAPGSAGANPIGKKYLVGATLTYRYGGEQQTLEVSPAVITVKPLPLLTLDYFLTQDVFGDDPLTAEIEAVEPFTLGVRVKNTGFAAAKNLKIDSAQPTIVENNQGLLINFKLTGSYVNDAPAQNTLLINFGDIAAATSKTGRWIMESSLAGKFTEFTAKFSHADELGGTLTSLIQATNAHLLIRDVRVDLPGRDLVRDFLGKDGDVLRVYESDGLDTIVTDRTADATLTVSGGNNFRLVFPPTAGFAYVRLQDPFSGQKVLANVVRSDAKTLLTENVWLSKTRNKDTKVWQYWINFFDVNSTGVYDTQFQEPVGIARPPALQFIADQVVKETEQVSFVVQASSPDGKPVTLSAAPVPAGATFTAQPANPQVPNLAAASFDWTPARGSAGEYLINYTATDGTLSTSRSAKIRVESSALPPGPGAVQIDSPLAGAVITVLKPTLSVLTSANAQDPTTKVQFEVYSDPAMSLLVANSMVDKAAPTAWRLTNDLNDNSTYYWRARGSDGTLFGPWANGRFFVNTFNDAPEPFNLTSPAANGQVGSLLPTLTWTNSADKDGDPLTYGVHVFKNSALTEPVVSVGNLPQGVGSTSWTPTLPLVNRITYYWYATAKDPLGSQTQSAVRAFKVNTGNTPPTAPAVVNPAVGGQSSSIDALLTILNGTDADEDLITYVFEIDAVNTFDSAAKRSSGQVIQGAGDQTSWTAVGLTENKRYWWRAKAQDGLAESAWVGGDFLVNAVNDAPPVPTVNNPGQGSWIGTQQPSLIANPVIDPEGEVVSYQYEVYKDAGLTQQVTQGTSANTGWIVPLLLADKTTHYWRVRALDAQGAASAWGPATVMYVSTSPYQAPTIAVTSPATLVTPDNVTVGAEVRKQVHIRWEGNDPNIEATVALYYGTSASGYVGTLIADGLHQASGTQIGNYVWDVTSLATGSYYIYAVIYDAKGVGRAYAPGTVVIAPPAPAGSVVVSAGTDLRTSEDGLSTTYKVRLGRAPIANVVVPLSSTNVREGVAAPTSLIFTPSNWAGDQTVTVAGRNDCAPDGSKTYQVLSGPAQSTDPDYVGLSGAPVSVLNVDNFDPPGTTNNLNVHICNLTLVSQRKVDAVTWEYVLSTELTNTGIALGGADAVLTKMPFGMRTVDANIAFGAVGQSETAKSTDTVTVRSSTSVAPSVFQLGIGFKWTVTTRP